MRYSRLLTKTVKQAPHDADSINARLLAQGGFVRQEMAGVYSWLPLGLRVLRNVERIIREEMDALGAQEILMPALQPKENWLKTGRWETLDVLFKIKSQTGKEIALGATGEEVVTPLVKVFLNSYKELPLAVYQIQTKYRDELRAKSGVLRGREFGMKDLYSFHATQEDLETYYDQVKEAYLRIYKRCGVEARVVEASGGAFTNKHSHEFQVLTEAGEDRILVCSACDFAQNSEIAEKEGRLDCPACGGKLEWKKGIEVGNIFDLGTKYTDVFDVSFTAEDGSQKMALMACFGIGTTRLVGAIVEASHDEKGIIWPKTVAPHQVYLISLKAKSADAQERVSQTSNDLYDQLKKSGVDVLWDDRLDVSPGEKFADADLIGVPIRLVVSEKTLKEESVEWKWRHDSETRLVSIQDIIEEVKQGLAAN
ncbi:MAG TPA: proline--tRNA ligase [Patescibacteria group bacterium]|nr:proline--tRNA ligase [Patescibacteria group bacterium]